MSDFWDKDIAAMDLSELERNGLQIFRNYQRAFEAHAEKKFSSEIDAAPFDEQPIKRILSLIASEDPRFLPVIVCAYVDDLLKTMFRTEVPDKVPGGASSLFGPYGPLASLFNRLQLAAVFDLISADIIQDIDRLRQVRNDLSHSWDISEFRDFFQDGAITELSAVDTLLAKHPAKPIPIAEQLDPLKIFRLRLFWIAARISYEALYYHRAKRSRLRPLSALYGPNRPQRRSTISGLACDASRSLFS